MVVTAELGCTAALLAEGHRLGSAQPVSALLRAEERGHVHGLVELEACLTN